MQRLRHDFGGAWVEDDASGEREVVDAATAEVLARVALSSTAEAARAVGATHEAFCGWRSTPAITRARDMFRLKERLGANFGELAPLVTKENGETIDEAGGEVRRTIENVDEACGIPSLLLGYSAEDVAEGVDSNVVRQPLGVFVHLTPSNHPAIVPCWFNPYALATGNTFVLKPSSQTPLTQNRLVELLDGVGLRSEDWQLDASSRELEGRVRGCYQAAANQLSMPEAARHVCRLAEEGTRPEQQARALA